MVGKPLRAACALLALLGACSAPPQRAPSTTKKPLPAVPLGGVWHSVTQGENVAALALRYGVPEADIEEINGLERWEPLAEGREQFIPGARSATSQPSRPSAPPPAATMRKTSDGGGGRFIWPLRGGTLTSGFGRRGKTVHEGIDIAAPEGTAVLAAADGTVMYSGSGVKGYGNLILLRHEGGFVTVYAHNRNNLIREKARVSQGQVIAEVGHTGRTRGDHLHFEVRQGDRPVDPMAHLPPRPE